MTAVSLEDYDRLISRIYEAALDHAGWHLLVDDLARLSGTHVVLHAHDFGGGYTLGAITTHEPEFMASYGSYYASINAWVPTLAAMPIGIAQQPERHYGREHLLKTEFYNDWLRPQRIVTGAGIVLHRDENRFLALAFNMGSDDEDRIMAPMLELLDRLAPHLQRSFGLVNHLSGQGIDARQDDSLDAVPAATFLVDRRGRLVRTNARGEAMLSGGQAVKLEHNGCLAFVDPLAHERVEQALGALSRGDHQRMSATFLARGDGAAGPWQGSIAPFRPASGFDAPPLSILTDRLPAAIIALSQPSPATGLDALADRFGLSPAERRVAEALYSGSTLQSFAGERGISIHTARNQLKSLMAKAGVARQSQLVALFASLLSGAQ